MGQWDWRDSNAASLAPTPTLSTRETAATTTVRVESGETTGMTALWTSFLVVVLAEMGDKTQLVALALAARYRRPWTVMLGILLATTANHALAATAGVWVSRLLPPAALAWALALSFIGFGVWTLVPDRAPATGEPDRWGPLLTTSVVFFLAEMGDKTQLATIALGARFEVAGLVTVGPPSACWPPTAWSSSAEPISPGSCPRRCFAARPPPSSSLSG